MNEKILWEGNKDKGIPFTIIAFLYPQHLIFPYP